MTRIPEADALLQQAFDARKRAKLTEAGNLEAQARALLRQHGLSDHDTMVYAMEFKEQAGRAEFGLRNAVVRLAHEHPELRPHLLPLLQKTAGAQVRSLKPGEWSGRDMAWHVTDAKGNWLGLITKYKDSRNYLHPYKVFRYPPGAGPGSQPKLLGFLYAKDPNDWSIVIYKPKEALQKAVDAIEGRFTLPRTAPPK